MKFHYVALGFAAAVAARPLLDEDANEAPAARSWIFPAAGAEGNEPFPARSWVPPAAGEETSTGQVARAVLMEAEAAGGEDVKREAAGSVSSPSSLPPLQPRGPIDWVQNKVQSLFGGKSWKDKKMWVPKIFRKGGDDDLEAYDKKGDKVDVEDKLDVEDDDIEKAKEQKPAQQNFWAQTLSRGLGWMGWKKKSKEEEASKEVGSSSSSSSDAALGVGAAGPITDVSVENPTESKTAKSGLLGGDKFDFKGATSTAKQWLSQMALTVKGSRMKKLEKYGEEGKMKDWFHTLVVIADEAKPLFKGGSGSTTAGTGSTGSLSNPLANGQSKTG